MDKQAWQTPPEASAALSAMLETGEPFDVSGLYDALQRQLRTQRESDLAQLAETYGRPGRTSAGAYAAGEYLAKSTADFDRLLSEIAMSSYENAMRRRMGALQLAPTYTRAPYETLAMPLQAALMQMSPEDVAIQRQIAEYGRTQYGFLPYAVQASGVGMPTSISSTTGPSPMWGLGGDIVGAAILAAALRKPSPSF